MNIFFDEDNGTGIPKALKLVRVPSAKLIEYPRNDYAAPVKKGAKDPEWIPWAGDNGFIVFSQNHRMIENPVEVDLFVRHRVGIVFAKSGSLRSHEVLRILLNHWSWLEALDARANTPFCYLLGPRGAPERYDLHQGPRTPRRSSSLPAPAAVR